VRDAGGDDRGDAEALAAPAAQRLRRNAFGRRLLFTGLLPRIDYGRALLGAAFEREMEAGRGFLWFPVLFGIGILAYFALPREPSAIAVVGLAAILIVSVGFARRSVAAFRLLVAAAAIASGVAAMKLRTDWVGERVMPRDMTTTVTGWVEAREATPRDGARLYLRVSDIVGLAASDTPRKIRVTVRTKTAAIAVGDAISLTARLQAPSGPVIPGGYDFGRAAFYDGIGGVGFAYGAAKPAALGDPPLDIRMKQPLARLREEIRERIEEALPGDNGRIAAALIMGDQFGVSEKTQDDMRASGLGHVLSISGLHMALVAGSVFWLIRALLALSTRLALRRPIKKWAAAGGLAVAAFYVGISGGGVATDRSFLMLAIMLGAIMLDRRAITLRNVALAAIAILVVFPESLLSVSFQMSFAATLALIAGYEAIVRRAEKRVALAEPGGHTIGRRIARAAGGLFLTSLLAGLATAPFGVYHFQRVAPLTMIANLAAMPAIGLIVMPMALAAALLMPFGLESLPLSLMSYGLDWMKLVAEKTAEWSAGLGGVRMPPASALILAVAGFLWLALWQERWRLAGLAPLVVALPLALSAPSPDIVVDAGGAAAAIRGFDGRYQIVAGKNARFAVENWLRADADPRDAKAPDLEKGVGCDALGCIARLRGGGEIAVIFKPDAFAEDCRTAVVVISRLQAPPACAEHALVLDRAVLARGGAMALYQTNDVAAPPEAMPRFRVETAYPLLRRPFMPRLPSLPAGGTGDQ
jgi:competence protein ComEC